MPAENRVSTREVKLLMSLSSQWQRCGSNMYSAALPSRLNEQTAVVAGMSWEFGQRVTNDEQAFTATHICTFEAM